MEGDFDSLKRIIEAGGELDQVHVMKAQTPVSPFDREETQEIHEEEGKLSRQLDELIACATERAQCQGDVREFYQDWIAGYPERAMN